MAAAVLQFSQSLRIRSWRSLHHHGPDTAHHPESAHAPTVTKSQNRHTKDSIYLSLPDGRYLFPTETILRRLQGIPDSFSLDGVNTELAAEQLGQSIDWSLHHKLAVAVAAHTRESLGSSGSRELILRG